METKNCKYYEVEHTHTHSPNYLFTHIHILSSVLWNILAHILEV